MVISTKSKTLFKLIKIYIEKWALQQSPNLIFLVIYKLKLFRRDTDYIQPELKTRKIIKEDLKIKMLTLLNQINSELVKSESALIDPSEYKKVTVKSKISTINNCLIIVPERWMSPDNNYTITQRQSIAFLEQGLKENGCNVRLVEANNSISNSTNLDQAIHEICQEIKSCDLIFLWSLTGLKIESNFFSQIEGALKAKKGKIIGVITSTHIHSNVEEYYEKWSRLVNIVTSVAEEFAFTRGLSKLFTHYHLPQIPYYEFVPKLITKHQVKVYFSGTIKHNRYSWIVALRYQCIMQKIEYKIRAIYYELFWQGLSGIYIPPNEFVNERRKFSLSLVITHRDANTDFPLIGSFWDAYLVGSIPIVQMQNPKRISSYLTPYLDYFPILNEIELYYTLQVLNTNPEILDALRERIYQRSKKEFTPKKIIGDFLDKLKD